MICQICGRPMTDGREICSGCKAAPPPYEALRSLTRYDGVMRDCVHALKYDNNQSLGEFFSARLTALVREAGWAVDLVLPVPLSPDRQAERGYNQSALLARPLALQLGLSYKPFGLTRIRNTPSQVALTAVERRKNVAGAFAALPEVVAGQRVLLVDDVTTTGSTLLECTRALKLADAKAVYGLTLSRPIHAELNPT